jgi:hypothetical protein
MSDPTNVFNENNQSTQTTTNDSPLSAFDDQLKQIKNENGEQKYGDLNKALDALKHSQDYIPSLKQELETKDRLIGELESKVKASKTIEETLEQLKTPAQDNTQATPSSLTGEDVQKLLNEALTQREVATIERNNEATVNSSLLQTYGDKAQEVVSKKAEELGMTVQEIQQLARKNPKLVLSQFQTSTPPKTNSTESSYRIGLNNPNSVEITPPEKSLLRGATTSEQVAYMRKIREKVYKENGITV